MREYRHARVRGLASWRPQRESLELLGQVRAVLAEYDEYLPLTIRQIFYRLVGNHGYPKDERAYERLTEKLNRGRRAKLIPFEAIRDDSAAVLEPPGFTGIPDFLESVQAWANQYERDRSANQPRRVELWVEAGGMAPQLTRVARRYGVPVYSSGGFDSLTVKYEAARRAVLEEAHKRETVILQVGDFDPSGLSIFDSAVDDITALVRDIGGDPHLLLAERTAVTPEQIARYDLETAPAKKSDTRGGWQGGTVQAEALSPAELAFEVEESITQWIDLDALDETLESEKRERSHLIAKVKALG